jgi:excisionase family DNA binding protein
MEEHQMNDSPTLYTVPQAAKALGCSVSAIRKWVKDGRLPSIRLSTAVRVRAEDLQKAARDGIPPAHSSR